MDPKMLWQPFQNFEDDILVFTDTGVVCTKQYIKENPTESYFFLKKNSFPNQSNLKQLSEYEDQMSFLPTNKKIPILIPLPLFCYIGDAEATYVIGQGEKIQIQVNINLTKLLALHKCFSSQISLASLECAHPQFFLDNRQQIVKAIGEKQFGYFLDRLFEEKKNISLESIFEKYGTQDSLVTYIGELSQIK